MSQQKGKGLHSYRNVSVPLPRFHYPADPVLLFRNLPAPNDTAASRFEVNGRLACRLTSMIGTGGVLMQMIFLRPRFLGSGAVPPEVDVLMRSGALRSLPYPRAGGGHTPAEPFRRRGDHCLKPKPRFVFRRPSLERNVA